MEPIRRVAIVGAGNMGSGIAQKSAQEGFSVQMIDREEGYVERGINTIKEFLQEAIQRRIFSESQVEAIMANITGVVGADSIHLDTDLVIEAVFEDIEVKSSVLNVLSTSCDEKTIIATNTSSLSVQELSSLSDRPDRFIGLHFFYHPAKNRLVEIIPSSSTSEETIQSVTQYCRAMGKVVILCKDRPGFVVNRFFVPWLSEACRLLDEGLGTPAQIDSTAGMFRYWDGSLRIDESNRALDRSSLVRLPLLQLETDRFRGADCLRKLVEDGGQWDLSEQVIRPPLSVMRRSRIGCSALSSVYPPKSLRRRFVAWKMWIGVLKWV